MNKDKSKSAQVSSTRCSRDEAVRTKSSTLRRSGGNVDSKDTVVSTNVCRSQNKFRTTFVSIESHSVQNRNMVTRSVVTTCKVHGSQTQKATVTSGAFTRSKVNSKSDNAMTTSVSVRSRAVSPRGQRVTTKGSSVKSVVVNCQSQHAMTTATSMKYNIHGSHSQTVEPKIDTICGVQLEPFKSKSTSRVRRVLGCQGREIVTKDTSVNRKVCDSHTKTNSAPIKTTVHREHGGSSQSKAVDSGTCFVTRKQLQLKKQGETTTSEHGSKLYKTRRKRRHHKPQCSESETSDTTKKFKDKVEIVDLHQTRGDHLSEGNCSHLLLEDESSIDVRSQAENMSCANICHPDVDEAAFQVENCLPGISDRLEPVDMNNLKTAEDGICAATTNASQERDAESNAGIVNSLCIKDVLPDSGSDMSISSDDSNSTEFVPATNPHLSENGGNPQTSSDITGSGTVLTSTVAVVPEYHKWNPEAAVFVPGCQTHSLCHVTQQPNMIMTSAHQQSQPWLTFMTPGLWPPHHNWSRQQTLPHTFPTQAMVANVTHDYMPYSRAAVCAAGGGIFTSASSSMAVPQQSQLARGPFLQPPLSGLPESSLAAPSPSSLCLELASHIPGSTIDLSIETQHTCPELTSTPRCWQSVQQVALAAAGSMEFSVMSYNILSQELLDRHSYLYDKCQESHLTWENRGPALLAQISAHHADIVCLQEVEEQHWLHDIKDTLALQGYEGVFKKPSRDKTDGCAVLFKTVKFRQLKCIPVEFLQGGILDRNNIGLILLLQPRKEVYGGCVGKICVATTHLLFNPRRGDVKLAQLVMLLAEIDKHAYMEDQDTQDTCIHDLSHSGTCAETHEAGQKNGVSLAPAKYCPIILCGDFNTEPFCDLYKFITRGYLNYDKCVSRLVCGQQEGRWNGTDRLVDRHLLPESLSICETCQYTDVLKERQNRDGASSSHQCPKVNTGQVRHCMNFRSVYTHFVQKGRRRNLEVSSHHNNCCCTVDYIFYSQPDSQQTCKHRTPVGNSDIDDNQSDTQHSDTKTTCKLDDSKSDSDLLKQSPLELVARYKLLTKHEVTKFGFMPNSVFPSDHLCLIARFILR